MKEKLRKPSPINNRKSESNGLKPIISTPKHTIGGMPEGKGQIQLLKKDLHTDQDTSGKDKKGKIYVNHETTQGPIKDSKIGYFRWVVKFLTNGKNGWIVQKMENTYDETLANGEKRTKGLPTKEYWEAWQVGANSSIFPSDRGNHDYWERGYTYSEAAKDTKGSWSIKGTAYFTQNDIRKQGFKKKNVPDAKRLLSTTSNPGKLGKKLLVRKQKGSWDATTK